MAQPHDDSRDDSTASAGIEEKLRTLPLDGSTMWETLQCARRLSPAASASLMRSLASAVLDIHEPTSQRRTIIQGFRLGGEPFLEVYVQLAASALARGAGQVGMAATLFVTWVREPRDFEREPWRTLLHRSMAEGLQGWRKADLDKLDARLKAQPEASALWVSWYEEHGGGGFEWHLHQWMQRLLRLVPRRLRVKSGA